MKFLDAKWEPLKVVEEREHLKDYRVEEVSPEMSPKMGDGE